MNELLVCRLYIMGSLPVHPIQNETNERKKEIHILCIISSNKNKEDE